MRWIFAALVLGNIGLLMWASWYRELPSGPRARPAVHAERLVPLTTPGVTPRARGAGAQPGQPLVAVDPEPPPAGAADCHGVGPYDTRVLAARAAARIAALELPQSIVQRPRQTGSGFWVFLPPQASRAAAEERIAGFAALGVREYRLVSEPDQENAISFGVFSQRRNAERLREDLARRGIEARIEPYRRTRREYWVSLKSASPTPEQRVALEQLARATRGVRLQAFPCANVENQEPAPQDPSP